MISSIFCITLIAVLITSTKPKNRLVIIDTICLYLRSIFLNSYYETLLFSLMQEFEFTGNDIGWIIAFILWRIRYLYWRLH